MDMAARNQYLIKLQDKYFRTASKKDKSLILDEYIKNTHQNRKYVIRKINSEIYPAPKKRSRPQLYDGHTIAALAKIWQIFDCPCGQRLAPILKYEVDRLRSFGEITISDNVASNLKAISPSTIDARLKHQKEVLHLKRKYHKPKNPLIYKKIPTRAGDWDLSLIGQIQIDSVEHCGSSNSGDYIHSISTVDVVSSWWEAEFKRVKSWHYTFELKKLLELHNL